MVESWTEQFQGLSQLPDAVKQRLLHNCRIMNFAQGSRIFAPGDTPLHFILLIEGTMRVQQVSESGREVVLYRVSGGESCALTISCFFSQETYHAEGIAETPIKAVAIGRAAFDDLIVQSEEFRRLVFSAFSARLVDLFHVIDDIVFSRLDIRLAQKLLQMADGACEIRATHQQLAVELGSAREVISRLLNEFQGRGWVKNSRGLILITNEQALRRLSTLQ